MQLITERTTITVSTKDGSGLSASCQITVPYTIKRIDLNGGKNNASNPSTYDGSRVSLKNPTRKGYTFAGWYTSSSYRTKVTALTSGSYTLYAKWKKGQCQAGLYQKLEAGIEDQTESYL